MGFMDDAKDAMNDAENKFHEKKGEIKGRIDQANRDSDDQSEAGRDAESSDM